MNFIINKIKNRFFLDKNEINFINFAKNNNKIISEESVLIEAAIDDNFLLIKNFLIGSYLQKKYKLKLVYYLNYFKSRAYKSLLKNIYNFFVYNYFSFLKCEKKYNSFCYKNVLNLNVLSKKKKFFNFKKLNFNKLIKLKYKGIKLGDLLIDSYQYYYYDFLYYDDLQKIIYDKRFQKLLIDSFLAVDHFEQVFQKYKIRILVNNYSGYLEHGIAARMAEKNKIPIFYVSDPDIAFIKSYASKHKKDYSKYKYKFKNHQINNANYNESKKLLSRRFQGFLDPAVHYLNDSVYNKNSKENLKLNNNKKKYVFFYIQQLIVFMVLSIFYFILKKSG